MLPRVGRLWREERRGEAYLARARLGQGTFHTLVTDAYHRRRAVTGERSLPALEAAHIKAHAADGLIGELILPGCVH